jgi:Fe-S cluster biogenesis protein NfuA
VAEEKEFRERVLEIGQLIEGLDKISDNNARTSARELVQLVMELHGVALDKVMEVVFESGPAGEEIIERLGRDPVVGGALVLHGLHPDDLETRVARAIEQLKPRLRKQDVEVELLGIQEGAVRVHVTKSAHACSSTNNTVRSTVEEAIYEAAPDVGSITIEGLDNKPANGFVALDQLMSSALTKEFAGAVAQRNDGD